jgi:hypothetical protein
MVITNTMRSALVAAALGAATAVVLPWSCSLAGRKMRRRVPCRSTISPSRRKR